ncbi:phospholipid methyltransferase [Colletotrichum sojae]|uniref:Phospholipid methyltransferase n=1 Tax=Colletotrichum sojae TaxID=2175907 RepID=A0A8H6MJB4_9PEZI|nr:phospholipid methyltransferase [Colletotrichum sojae]
MLTYLIGTWLIIAMSLIFLVPTIVKLFPAGDIKTLTSWPALKEVWFSNAWVYIGRLAKAGAEPMVYPLLEGRVRDRRVTEQVSGSPLQGVVLEIGAGSGLWMDAFDNVVRAAKTQSRPGPTKIYGIEPNVVSAASLRQRVGELGSRPHMKSSPSVSKTWGMRLPGEGGSSLAAWTASSPCSVFAASRSQRRMSACFTSTSRRAGGGMCTSTSKPSVAWWFRIFNVSLSAVISSCLFESFNNDLSGFTNLFWEHAMGSCQLCRRTGETSRQAGQWTEVDLAKPAEESFNEVVPISWGP